MTLSDCHTTETMMAYLRLMIVVFFIPISSKAVLLVVIGLAGHSLIRVNCLEVSLCRFLIRTDTTRI